MEDLTLEQIYAELLKLTTLTGNYSYRESSSHRRWWEDAEYTEAWARAQELKAELTKRGLSHHPPGVPVRE